MSVVLLFSRDPGATNQLVAVSEMFETGIEADVIPEVRRALDLDGNVEFRRLAGEHAASIWHQAGHQCEDWTSVAGRETDAEAAAKQILETIQPSGLITGLDDIDEPRTVALWRVGLSRNLPVVVFADNNVNLSPRCRSRVDGLLTIPTRIFVHDAASANELITAGMPTDRIVQTHDVHLLRLRGQPRPNGSSVRSRWGLSSGARVVLFASENVGEMVEYGRPPRWNEFEVVADLLARLRAGRPVGDVCYGDGQPVALVIRPHPRDRAGKYDALACDGPVAVIVSAEGSSREAAAAADVVTGIGSALLSEAEILGAKVIRLTPGSINS